MKLSSTKNMANPNPNTDNLALGRGKRPKLNHETVSVRMSAKTRQILEEIAKSYSCFYGGKPWIAGLLERIGRGELIVVPTPPQSIQILEATLSEAQKAELERLKKKNAPWLNVNPADDFEEP
jgi:hypothetical protein